MSTVATNFTGSSLDAALAALEVTLADYGGIVLLSVLLDQSYDATGALVEVVDVSFEIVGKPGVFTVYPPFGAGWEYDAIGRVINKAGEVMSIYEGQPNALAGTGETPIPIVRGGQPGVQV